MSSTGIFTVVKNMCVSRVLLLYEENLITQFWVFFSYADIKLNIKLNRCRAVFFERRHRTVVLDAVRKAESSLYLKANI